MTTWTGDCWACPSCTYRAGKTRNGLCLLHHDDISLQNVSNSGERITQCSEGTNQIDIQFLLCQFLKYVLNFFLLRGIMLAHMHRYLLACVSERWQLSTYTVKNNALYLMKLSPQSILDFLKDFKALITLLIASLMLIAMSLVLIAVVVVVCFGLQALSWSSDECLRSGNIRLANYMLILWCNRCGIIAPISMVERGGRDGWRRREIN